MDMKRVEKKTEEFLQYGIESFLKNRFDKARTFFSLVLSKEPNNRIAQFGLMCVDAIEDGMTEAKDMFSVFIFADEQQKEALLELFDKYAKAPFSGGSSGDYLYSILSLYNVKATSIGDDLYLSRIEPDNSRSIDTNELLGKVYERLGDYSKAIDYMARAAQLRPFDDKLRKELINIVKKSKKDE